MLKHMKRNRLFKGVTAIIATVCILIAVPVIVNVASTGQNIARKATVASECPGWAKPSFEPEKMIDGNKTNFSTSTYGDNENMVKDIYLTFDATYNIDEVQLYPRVKNSAYAGGFPKDFTVSLWNGTTWVEVANRTNYSATTEPLTLSFKESAYRALRIRATKLDIVDGGPQFGLQLAEIEVYGKVSSTAINEPFIPQDAGNVAKTAAIEAECPDFAVKAGLIPEKMIDGGKDTFYTSTYEKNADKTKDIYLTFDAAYNVNEVLLYPRIKNSAYAGGFPKDFTVSLWNGTSWVEVASQKDYNATSKALDLTFVPVGSRAMRIHVTELDHVDGGEQYGLQLAEIEVKGATSSETIEMPTVLLDSANVAPASKITAECPTEALSEHGPQKMIDSKKNDGNYFTSANTDSETEKKEIQLVFDTAYKVNEVILYPHLEGGAYAGGFPKDFTVSMWNGTEWVEVAAKTDYASTGNGLVLNFTPGDYRAVCVSTSKLDTVYNGSQFGLQLAEIEVYGVQAKGNVAAPPQEDGKGDESDTPANIALNSEVVAEYPDWAKDFKPQYLVDGNTTNCATSEYVENENTEKDIYLIFDKTYKISELTLYPRTRSAEYAGGFPKDFTVSIWNGTKWVEVASRTGAAGTAQKMSIAFDAVDARAVWIKATKLDIVDGGPKYGLQLAEVEVQGITSTENIAAPSVTINPGTDPDPDAKSENVALGAEVVAECPAWAQAAFNPKKLVDGNLTNTATSTYEQKADTVKEVYITFDRTYNINEMVLYPRVRDGQYIGGFPEDFTVSVWTGTEWKDVVVKTGMLANADKVSLSFEAIDARAVRLCATKLTKADGGEQFALQLAEIMVNGVPAKTVIGKPQIQLPEDGNSENEGNGEGSAGNDMYGGASNGALYGIVTAECPNWALKDLGPERLVDKNRTNFYTSTYAGTPRTTKEIYVTFEQTHSIHTIAIYPRVRNGKYVGGFPETFTVSVWTGTEWKQVGAKTGYKSGVSALTFEFNSIICNGMRIQATRLSTTDDGSQFALQLAEIEALGSQSEVQLAAPDIKTETDSKITIDNEKNIALNAPAKASTDWAKFGAGIANINDGNTGTFFATDGDIYEDGGTEWAEINLLDNYSINTVILASRSQARGFPYDFTISVFCEGKWTDVVTETNFEADESDKVVLYEFKFSPVIGNKIRISSNNFRKAGNDRTFIIAEMAVYGSKAAGDYGLPNENMVCSNTTILSTTTMNDYGYYLSHLNDGDLTTEWSSQPTTSEDEEQVIEVDFKREVQLGEVQLKPGWGGNGFPVDFTISVFMNEEWVEVYRATDYEKPINEAIQRFSFEPKRTTKFRITITKMESEGGLYVVKLNELMAYPYATGDDFDDNKVDEIKYEKIYEATEVNDTQKESKLPAVNIIQLILGIVLIIGSVCGCILLIKKLNKRESSKEKQ